MYCFSRVDRFPHRKQHCTRIAAIVSAYFCCCCISCFTWKICIRFENIYCHHLKCVHLIMCVAELNESRWCKLEPDALAISLNWKIRFCWLINGQCCFIIIYPSRCSAAVPEWKMAFCNEIAISAEPTKAWKCVIFIKTYHTINIPTICQWYSKNDLEIISV